MVMVPTLLLAGSELYSVLGVTVPCALNVSCAASVPTSCTPELVNTVTWLLTVGDDPNVHQLRQLIDVLVALVEQRRRRCVGPAVVLQLVVDDRDLLHRIVGGGDGIVDAGLGVGAQVLDALRGGVELLRQRLRGIDDADARRRRIRTGRQRLHRGGQLVERILDACRCRPGLP